MAETYAPASSGGSAVSDVQDAVQDLRDEGLPIRHLRSILIPDDEMCFHVFDAPSAASVSDVGRRAGIPFERIMPITEFHGHRV